MNASASSYLRMILVTCSCNLPIFTYLFLLHVTLAIVVVECQLNATNSFLLQVTLDCHSPAQLSVLHTPQKYLTLRLDKKSNTGYDFQIIVTRYKQGYFFFYIAAL